MNAIGVFSLECLILACMLFYLSLRVIKYRQRDKIATGAKTIALEKAIRAQGNFTEYVPITLIIHLGLAIIKVNAYLLALFAILLIIGRIFHAYSLLSAELLEKPTLTYRKLGMKFTFASTIFSAICFVFYAFFIM
ncbi:MAPEG family protein [Thiotrichales bacterium 19X7-9]|nr:MAPEG family protein [Thiotrichales bacterium 19X7-9]